MKHLPNLLTAARIAMAPYIFFLMWTGEFRSTLVWFGVAALTDLLDGFLARRFHVSSRVGGYLDPVADKILLSGSFLVLGLTGAIPLWLVVLVLGRDVLLLAGAGVALQSGLPRDLSPSIWGKWSTICQMAYLLLVLAGFPSAAAAGITAGITLWSGISYVRRFLVLGK